MRFLLQRGSFRDGEVVTLEEGVRMLLLLQGKTLQLVGGVR